MQEVTLSFPSGETIKSINVAVGQRVKAGDVLGTVDVTDLQLALQQAQSNVATAQAKYDATAAGALPKDIAVAQSNVDAARAKYQATATILPKDIQTAQANLDSAIAKYNATVTISPKDIEVARANLASAIAGYNADDRRHDDAAGHRQRRGGGALRAGETGRAEGGAAQGGRHLGAEQGAAGAAEPRQDQVRQREHEAAGGHRLAEIRGCHQGGAARVRHRQRDLSAGEEHEQGPEQRGWRRRSGGVGRRRCRRSRRCRLDTLKQAADSAFLTEQQAEKTQEAARLTYENSKNAEINNVATAQQQVNDAQSALSKLIAGPTNEDVTQAQAAVDQAQVEPRQAEAGADRHRCAEGAGGVDSARATLNDLLAGPEGDRCGAGAGGGGHGAGDAE